MIQKGRKEKTEKQRESSYPAWYLFLLGRGGGRLIGRFGDHWGDLTSGETTASRCDTNYKYTDGREDFGPRLPK